MYGSNTEILESKSDEKKWHFIIRRSNKGDWMEMGLLLRDRIERNAGWAFRVPSFLFLLNTYFYLDMDNH